MIFSCVVVSALTAVRFDVLNGASKGLYAYCHLDGCMASLSGELMIRRLRRYVSSVLSTLSPLGGVSNAMKGGCLRVA